MSAKNPVVQPTGGKPPPPKQSAVVKPSSGSSAQKGWNEEIKVVPGGRGEIKVKPPAKNAPKLSTSVIFGIVLVSAIVLTIIIILYLHFSGVAANNADDLLSSSSSAIVCRGEPNVIQYKTFNGVSPKDFAQISISGIGTRIVYMRPIPNTTSWFWVYSNWSVSGARQFDPPVVLELSVSDIGYGSFNNTISLTGRTAVTTNTSGQALAALFEGEGLPSLLTLPLENPPSGSWVLGGVSVSSDGTRVAVTMTETASATKIVALQLFGPLGFTNYQRESTFTYQGAPTGVTPAVVFVAVNELGNHCAFGYRPDETKDSIHIRVYRRTFQGSTATWTEVASLLVEDVVDCIDKQVESKLSGQDTRIDGELLFFGLPTAGGTGIVRVYNIVPNTLTSSTITHIQDIGVPKNSGGTGILFGSSLSVSKILGCIIGLYVGAPGTSSGVGEVSSFVFDGVLSPVCFSLYKPLERKQALGQESNFGRNVSASVSNIREVAPVWGVENTNAILFIYDPITI